MKQTLLSFLILVVCIPTQSQTDQFPITIQEVKKSVVPIFFAERSKTGGFTVRTESFVGTAFFLETKVRGKRTIATAAHILDTLKRMAIEIPENKPKIQIGVPVNGWKGHGKDVLYEYYETHECQKHGQADIAVCTLIQDPFDDPSQRVHLSGRRLSDKRVPLQTKVAFTGFPNRNIKPFTAKSFIVWYMKTKEVDAIWADGETWPRSSGSPLYDIDGTVVGVVSAQLAAFKRGSMKVEFDMDAVFIAVPSYYVIELVNRLNAEGSEN